MGGVIFNILFCILWILLQRYYFFLIYARKSAIFLENPDFPDRYAIPEEGDGG
jgi:hypothetical protein